MKQPFNLLIFPLLTLIAAIVIIANNHSIIFILKGLPMHISKSALSGNIRYGTLCPVNNDISFEGLEPDIVWSISSLCLRYSHPPYM